MQMMSRSKASGSARRILSLRRVTALVNHKSGPMNPTATSTINQTSRLSPRKRKPAINPPRTGPTSFAV